MKKIVTVIGARPQFIKMALVSKELKRKGVSEVVVHTGQHYDKNMSDIFFSELKIPKPRYNLAVGPGLRSEQIARMLSGMERILKKERPGMVLVYGDTNSTLAGALAASKLNIKIAHVEAGLRSFNLNMPEEVNRTATDSISDIFFCPTKTSVYNLKREGKSDGVYLVGDVMYDSIKKYAGALEKAFRPGGYILCTVHRAENTDDRKNLKRIFKALSAIKRDIILPLHPRTSKYLKLYGIKPRANIKLIAPVSYVRMLELERGASVIITDSGGVQKEALIFGVPCVTLREETEWVETVENGVNFIVGTDPKKIVRMTKKALGSRKKVSPERFYGDGSAYKRIAHIIKTNV